jgi:ABC-type transporter Mla maintaining outer membrane lipid asymmetry ATPase subunit MlaF
MTRALQVELQDVDVVREEDPSLPVVRGVRWSVREGDWWTLEGAPSCGSSALLATAAGLNPPARGAVRLFGCDLAHADDAAQTAVRREVGFVFERGGRLFGQLSVAENVALPLRYHEDLGADEARSRVAALLESAGLDRFADLLPRSLSLALQQRVALVRALANPVRILFLDDPLRGLPAADAHWWLAFLSERRAAGKPPISVVVCTHDRSTWRDHSDHFARVESGQFRETDAGEGG